MKHFLKVLLLAIVSISFIFTSPAYCYINPGIGSLVMQVFIAVFFTAIFTIKHFWKNIKNYLAKKFGKHPSQ
ncbi:MAG: hypothetical protein A2252_04045 [Elusimicrobia bacterium RIFOXYA2_FULL_39_19]|nr:MAG: hypothetical protein A2252_04045 [Elusimicrobia bacterium RIFOXYA2_FULL_39_19]